MSERLLITSPLEVDGWEVIESLEELSLFEFDGYRDLSNDAIALLNEVQSMWREHQNADGEWPEHATSTASDVLRLAYNIRQGYQRYGDPLSDRIRSSIGLHSGSPISDGQLEGAMAMASACLALRVLGNWLEVFEIELYRVRPDLVARIESQDKQGFTQLIERRRDDLSASETESLERVHGYLSEASIYLTKAKGTLREKEALASARKKQSQAGEKGGHGNRKADSVAQQKKAATRERIKDAACRVISSRPGISRRDLVSSLFSADIATRPTIKAHLDALGILTEEK